MNNTPTSPHTGIGAGSLEPQKKWEERTQEEKIETLRTELFNYRYVTRRVAELEAKIHQLKLHEHGQKGEILIPISSSDAYGVSGSLGAQIYDNLA